MATKVRKKYSEEYKRDVVRMLEEKGISANSLAVDMGIGVGLLHKWKSKYGKNKGGGETETSEAELKRLRKRLLEVEEERDILKKAVAIFTQVPRTDTRS
jgi:transposase